MNIYEMDMKTIGQIKAALSETYNYGDNNHHPRFTIRDVEFYYDANQGMYESRPVDKVLIDSMEKEIQYVTDLIKSKYLVINDDPLVIDTSTSIPIIRKRTAKEVEADDLDMDYNGEFYICAKYNTYIN